MTEAEKRTRTRRLLVWGGAALIALAIAVSLAPKPEPADFAAVERGRLRVTLDEEGETRVRDRYVVSAPLAGRVLRIELEPGDPVAAGETVLATFQPNDPVLLDARSRAEAEARVKAADAALGRARADLERARAELRKAEADLERFARLAAEEIVSEEQLEAAELAHDTRQKAVRAAEFAARTAAYDLEVERARLVEPGDDGGARAPIAIRSPTGGVVLKRLRESETVVPAGEPLLEVGDPGDLEIVSDLLSTDAVKVRPGQKVLIEQWGGDGPLHGVVRRVEPSGFMKISALGVEEQRVNVVIDFEDPRQAREALGDGYRVEVRIVTWEADDVLTIPTSSLFRHGGEGRPGEEGWAVFAVENGRAALRQVEIGRRNGLAAQVLGGLEEGQRVIVHPSDAIADGVRVDERGI